MTRDQLILLCRDARLRAGLRQIDIAKAANVTQSSITHFERDGLGGIDIFLGYVNAIPGLFFRDDENFRGGCV